MKPLWKLPEARNPRLWLAAGVVAMVLLWSPVKDLFVSSNSVQEKALPPKTVPPGAAKGPPRVATAPAQNKPSAQIAKRDGTVDSRSNDLDELCKDWVYYRTKILKFTKEGDARAASEAQTAFADVNAWLSEYRDTDVANTCAKYDTPEFIRRYL